MLGYYLVFYRYIINEFQGEPIEKLTPKKLKAALPELISEYLDTRSKENQKEKTTIDAHGDLKDKISLLHKNYIVATEQGFDDATGATSTKVNWNSDKTIEAEDMKEISEALAFTLDRIFRLNPEKYLNASKADHHKQATNVYVVRDMFENDNLEYEHYLAVNQFGYFIRDKFLKEVPEEDDIKFKVEFFNGIKFNKYILPGLLKLYDLYAKEHSSVEAEDFKQVVNSIVRMTDADYVDFGTNKASKAIGLMKKVFDKPDLELKQALIDIMQILDEHLEDAVVEKGLEVDIRPYKLAFNDKIILTRKNSLLLCPLTDKPPQDEIKNKIGGRKTLIDRDETSAEQKDMMEDDPIMADLLKAPPKKLYHNIGLYDCDGNEVYWGDLSVDDPAKLQGPYYLLRETPGSNDQFQMDLKRFDKSRALDYIRLHAEDIIDKGEVIPVK